MRINGRAEITTDAELCASFAMQGKAPRSVLVVTAERVYFQCPKALVRSRLWSKEAQIAVGGAEHVAKYSQAITKGGIDGEAYDAGLSAAAQGNDVLRAQPPRGAERLGVA